MKVLYLSTYYYPENLSSSYLGTNTKEAIIQAGMQIVIYVPTPSRGISKELRVEYRHRLLEKSYNGMMTIHRFPLFAEGESILLRTIRYFLQCLKEFNRAILSRDARSCDVMIIPSTPPIQGVMAACVKKISKKSFIYNLQDIFPDSLVGTGLAKENGVLWRIGRKMENFTYRSADKIIVISEDFKRNIMAKGVPEEKIEVIYNWVDQNAVTPIENVDNDLFEEFDIDRDKFCVVYAGNLGNAQNIELIMNAARRLKDTQEIEFVIFGTGGLESEIKAEKETEQLSNLKILPLQPYERVSKVYGLGDVCIVACKPGLGGAAMPSKTWSIMSAGRAVLANFDEGELKQIVEQNGCGVFTQAGDLDGFVSAIETLSKDRDRCREMGARGREFILNNLTKEVGTQKYVDVIKSVVKER